MTALQYDNHDYLVFADWDEADSSTEHRVQSRYILSIVYISDRSDSRRYSSLGTLGSCPIQTVISDASGDTPPVPHCSTDGYHRPEPCHRAHTVTAIHSLAPCGDTSQHNTHDP